MKIIKTPMTRHYTIGLIFRVSIFIITLVSFLIYGNTFYEFVRRPYIYGISLLRILWFIFMIMMISHLIPSEKLPMSLRKYLKNTYDEQPGYSRLELLENVQDQNQKAWIVMLVWLVFNSIFGLLYLFDIIGNAHLLMLTVFYYLCDYICILFYCPFQSIIMKNKCCVNCRIYDWGHFMMFTPMLFIKDFFSWSLFFMSVIVLIHWEIIYAKHPQRFFEKSNKTLQCRHCKDKTCQVKTMIARSIKGKS